jgi:hypothetical protein
MITKPEVDLISHAVVGLIGMALNERTNLSADAATVSPVRNGAMSHANILSGDVALVCLGKAGFEAVHGVDENGYFAEAPRPEQVPPRTTCDGAWTLIQRTVSRRSKTTDPPNVPRLRKINDDVRDMLRVLRKAIQPAARSGFPLVRARAYNGLHVAGIRHRGTGWFRRTHGGDRLR